MKWPKVSHSKISNRLIYVFLIILGLVVILAVIARAALNGTPEALIRSSKLPYSPLVPNILPNQASFKLNDASYYKRQNHLLVLDWVFPAETLPGQGSLYIYQTDRSTNNVLPSIVPGPVQNVKINGEQIRVTISRLSVSQSVPTTPGELVGAFSDHEINVEVISYAIDRSELIKIISSLYFYN